MNERPNILLIVVDCARSDAWLAGRTPSLTPNLDRIRRAGVSFPTTIVETSMTSPNFATLLTGLYSHRHGVRMILGQSLRGDVCLLTEEFAARGYHTYAEVTGPLIADIGLGRGFDKYDYRAPCDYLHTAWGDRFVRRLKEGKYLSPWLIMLHLWEVHVPRQVVPKTAGRTGGGNGYGAAVASLDSQLERVVDAAGEDAFLLITGDHGEKTRNEIYRPGTAVDYIRDYLGIDRARGANIDLAGYLAGPSALHHLVAEFIAPTLEEAGRQGRRPAPSFALSRRIGDVLRLMRLLPKITPIALFVLKAPLKLTAWLHKSGVLDEKRSRERVRRFLRDIRPESLAAMSSRLLISSYKKDCKEGHSLHVYDNLVKVPLVMRWTGRLPSGATIPRMVRQPDILPTVLDVLGSPGSGRSDIDGRSFKPLLDGGLWEPPPAFLSTGGYLSRVEINGIRTEDWKYSYGPYNTELPQELYDLRRDPGERTNIAAAKPEVCKRLRVLAESFSRSKEAAPASGFSPDREQSESVERRLKDLGYLD
jgi:arylsulfatase A-like enzyme